MLIVLVYSKYSIACTNIIRTMQQVDNLPPIDTICIDSQEAKKMVKNSRVSVKSVPTFLVFNRDGRVEVYDGISAIQFINDVIRSSMPPPPPPMPRVLPLPNEENDEPPHRGGYAPPTNKPPPKRKEYIPEVVPPDNDVVSAIVSSAVLKERRPAEEVQRPSIQIAEDNYGGQPVVERTPIATIGREASVGGHPFGTSDSIGRDAPEASNVGIPSTPPVPGRSKGGKVDISAILAQAQAEQQQRGLQH